MSATEAAAELIWIGRHMALKRGRRKGRKKRVLTDTEYLAAKARAARNKERGDSFELLILLLFVIRSAALYFRGRRTAAPDAVVHLYNGEFVDDIKFSGLHQNATRFIHAKSGATVKWNRNLKRDFTSQALRVVPGIPTSLELWVGTYAKRQEMIDRAPAGLPRLRYHVLNEDWLDQHPHEIARIALRLQDVVRFGNAPPSLLRGAWDRIKAAQSELGRNATVADIMQQASDTSHHMVRSLSGTGAGLSSFLAALDPVDGLEIAADGDTMIFWNETFEGLCSEDIRRVPWSVLKQRIDDGISPKTRDDFFLLLGAVK